MYDELKELSVSIVLMLVFAALACMCHYYRQQYLKERNEPRVKCIYTIILYTHWFPIGFVSVWMQRAISHIDMLPANITFICHPYRMPSMSKNHYWSRTQKKAVDGWQSIIPSKSIERLINKMTKISYNSIFILITIFSIQSESFPPSNTSSMTHFLLNPKMHAVYAVHRFLADSAGNFGCCKIILILHWHNMFTLAVYLKKMMREREREWMGGSHSNTNNITDTIHQIRNFFSKLIASFSSAIALFVVCSSLI